MEIIFELLTKFWYLWILVIAAGVIETKNYKGCSNFPKCRFIAK